MKNLRSLVGILVLCTNTVAFTLTSTVVKAAPKPLNGVAVIVNNGVVLESEVVNTMNSVKLNASRSGQQLPDDETLHHQIVERLIIDSIIQQIGQNAGIRINDQDVDQAIINIAQQNRISINQLREHIAADGMNYETYREQIRKDMLLSEVRNNEVRRRVNILPQEIDSLAKQIAERAGNQSEFNLSHILIGLPENPNQQQVDRAEKQANSLVKQLKKGANFSKIAATYSADAQALQGGNMGWNNLEELPVIFADSLTKASKGGIIGPIRSGVGFHILRVNDLRYKEAPSVTETEYHARHILLKPSVLMNDEQTVTQLNEFKNKISSGEASFEQLASEYSQDPGSAVQGGDLGWAIADIYDPPFRHALTSLEKGQISTPVRSSFGWHLIELVDVRHIDGTENAMKQQAHRLLFNRKFAEEVQGWMQEERAGAYVKILADTEQ